MGTVAMFDRSLLAHQQRQEFLAKHTKAQTGEWCNVLVWILRKDGNVFGSCVKLSQCGPNQIHGGDHDGLLWWPQ